MKKKKKSRRGCYSGDGRERFNPPVEKSNFAGSLNWNGNIPDSVNTSPSSTSDRRTIWVMDNKKTRKFETSQRKAVRGPVVGAAGESMGRAKEDPRKFVRVRFLMRLSR